MWLDYKQTGTFNAWTFVTWPFVAEVAVIYGLLWLIVRAYRSSGGFVILTTVNHAGKDYDSFAAGLAADLANDLACSASFTRQSTMPIHRPRATKGFPR